MDNKKKICFLIPSVKSGGVETYLLRFLKYQNGAIDATVLVRNSAKGELDEAYRATGAKLVFKPLGYFNLSAIRWYYSFFKKEKFNTVCDFNANFAGLPMFLSKLAGIKKRITFYRQSSHHFDKTAFRLAYTNFMNRLVYKYSTHIFANSAAGLEFFFKNEFPGDKRFRVIKNGVNIDDYTAIGQDSKSQLRENLGLPQNKFIVGHTGRFAEAKNHYFLLNVAKELVDSDASFYFVLIGNDTDKLKANVDQLGITNNVLLLGYRNNIPEYLKAFDMFFFPSVTEGQPNALIEAMICGLPIATSNIPPIVECLPKDRLGCLIDPYNVETTVAKIKEIRNNPKQYVYKQFATENFDAKVQFAEFKETL